MGYGTMRSGTDRAAQLAVACIYVHMYKVCAYAYVYVFVYAYVYAYAYLYTVRVEAWCKFFFLCVG